MVTVALVLLIVGILSTGSTRETVYSRASARKGGRMFCIVGIALAYMLNILWIAIISITAILSFIYLMFSELCASLTVYTEDSCLNFSVFRPLVKDFSDAVGVITAI